jgi:hypothetical protein
MSKSPTMYQCWRDSVPATPFPFDVKDKHDGRITQTWTDVREKMNKDATNYALPFCTGHFTPAVTQSIMIDQMIRTERKAALRRGLSPLSSPDRATTASRCSSREFVARPLSPDERSALYNPEGGGRGRKEFLALRRRLPVKERFPLRTLSSQVYGWESVPQRSSSVQVGTDHRLKSTTSHVMRSCYVFDKKDPWLPSAFPPHK